MKRAYINGILLDGTIDMEPLKGAVILTDGEKIERVISPEDNQEIALDDYEIVDLGGKYLMPGLINLHVHLPGSGKPQKRKRNLAKLIGLLTGSAYGQKVGRQMCAEYAQLELFSGVTTIRTVGGIADFDTVVRDRIAAGELQGPRILASNMAVSVPEGHMAGTMAYIAESEEDARKYVQFIAKDKPDLIKLMITGGVLDATVKGEPGALKMPPAYVKAACEEAHKLHLPVAAHVESPEGVKVALANGVNTIEHGAMPDEEMIRLFQEKQASLVTTISPALPFVVLEKSKKYMSEVEQYNGRLVLEGTIECARQCLEHGIVVGLGNDVGCPYVTHYDMWRELYYFHKYVGVSNGFALHTATQKNAEIAGIADITGTIAEGKAADFIVTEDNPLEDIRALRNISMVVARGKQIDNRKIKKIGRVERELNKILMS